MLNNLSIVVGRGTKIKLWTDINHGGTILKDAFPRVYALAYNKVGSVNVMEDGIMKCGARMLILEDQCLIGKWSSGIISELP